MKQFNYSAKLRKKLIDDLVKERTEYDRLISGASHKSAKNNPTLKASIREKIEREVDGFLGKIAKTIKSQIEDE